MNNIDFPLYTLGTRLIECFEGYNPCTVIEVIEKLERDEFERKNLGIFNYKVEYDDKDHRTTIDSEFCICYLKPLKRCPEYLK